MRLTKYTRITTAAFAGLMLVAAGAASAGNPNGGGKPVEPGYAMFDCTVLLESLQTACNINNDLADAETNTVEGAYTGSCDGGGRCDDSVYNKLTSASNKIGSGKLADACANFKSIQDDLLVWMTVDKPKVDQQGYNALSSEISIVEGMYGCK